MKRLLNMLGSIPSDKMLHFIVGMLITAIVAVIVPRFAPIAMTVAVVAGFAKELRDEIAYGGFDWKDLLSTILGGVVMQVFIWIA
jgi:hypothetical protein